jgi:Rrf2 family protein
VPIARIAEFEGISGVYAAKLMRQLRLAGLVISQRGVAGGYRLARPAEEISVWDATQALDQSFLPTTTCDCEPIDRIDCRRTTDCALSSLWRRLGNEIRQQLSEITLKELCAGSLDQPAHIILPVIPGTTAARHDSPASRRPRPKQLNPISANSANSERTAQWPS